VLKNIVLYPLSPASHRRIYGNEVVDLLNTEKKPVLVLEALSIKKNCFLLIVLQVFAAVPLELHFH